MADVINYNCDDDLGDQILNDCGEELLGGIDAAVLLASNHLITNPSNGTQIAAEIAAGRATLVRNIKVGITKASPIEVESNVACSAPKLVNYDRAATYIDGNVSIPNISFYNNLANGRSLGGIIFHLCGTADADSGEKVLWLNSEVKLTGSLVVPADNNSFMMFDGDLKWRKKAMPLMYHNPVGIFV